MKSDTISFNEPVIFDLLRLPCDGIVLLLIIQRESHLCDFRIALESHFVEKAVLETLKEHTGGFFVLLVKVGVIEVLNSDADNQIVSIVI